MAKSATILFQEEGLLNMEAITAAAGGLDKALRSLQLRLDSIFGGVTLAQYLGDALKASGKLDKELLVMRLALGKLRVAIGDAFAPIGQVVLPLVNDAIFAAIRFVKSAGKIIRALFGVKDSASDAADAELSYSSAVSTASKAVRRSLASFDQLNRLQETSGSGVGSSNITVSRPDSDKMNLQEFLIFNTLSNMLAPLKEINLSPMIEALKELREAVRPITKQLFDGLRWAWDNIFVPIITWSAEILLPAVIDALSSALLSLERIIESCKPALTYLWENFLQPLGKWAGQYLLLQMEEFQQKLDNMATWTEMFPPSAQQVLLWFSQFTDGVIATKDLMALFNMVTGSGTDNLQNFGFEMWSLTEPFGQLQTKLYLLMGGIHQMSDEWDITANASVSAKAKMESAWSNTGNWFQDHVFTPLNTGFREVGNGILSSFSGVSGGATNGMNGLINAINRINFTIPDWVPILGGKSFGFNIPILTPPTIPMLAKGAVLPANKPFLAMVGDQRHGTNVEAPLSTIQDAVRIELQDLISSNLAGQEAITGVLRQILEAVLGISISDRDIAVAAQRYQNKMAVVRGSLL